MEHLRGRGKDRTMADCCVLKQEGEIGWLYVRNNSIWKRRYLVISDGCLHFFSSDQKTRIKKNVSLGGSQVCVVGPSLSQKFAGESTVSRQCEMFLRQPFPDQCYSCETTLVVIEPNKGKPCYLLAMNQKEANSWRITIKKAESAPLKAFEKKSKNSFAPRGPKDIMSRATSAMRRSFESNKKVDACGEDTIENLKGNHSTNGDLERINCSKLINADTVLLDPLWPELDTLQGCTDFLRSNSHHAHALEHARLMVDHFKGCYQMGDSSLSNEFRLEAWRGTMRRIIKALVDQLLICNPSLKSCMTNEEHMNQLWLACETWIFGAVHDKIMGACKQMFAIKDKTLDETLAKLLKVDPLALGVRREFGTFVLGDALHQFKLINKFTTPLEKAICLRKTINYVLEGIKSVVKSYTGAMQDMEELLPCTDDLLSFMVLLMARAKVHNLQANALYMENFLYVNKDCNKGELGFHITNFLAASNYLQSKELKDIVSQDEQKSGQVSSTCLPAPSVHDINTIIGDGNSNSRSRSYVVSDTEGWSDDTPLYRKGGISFPGETPDFLLASTYQ